jgi:hypothetical protein
VQLVAHGRYGLVPLYACQLVHLRALTTLQFWGLLSSPEVVARQPGARRAAYAQVSALLARAGVAPDAPDGVRSLVRRALALAHDEAAHPGLCGALSSADSSAGGFHPRLRALEWATYGGADTAAEAARAAVLLCREVGLASAGDASAAAAAYELFEHVLPRGGWGAPGQPPAEELASWYEFFAAEAARVRWETHAAAAAAAGRHPCDDGGDALAHHALHAAARALAGTGTGWLRGGSLDAGGGDDDGADVADGRFIAMHVAATGAGGARLEPAAAAHALSAALGVAVAAAAAARAAAGGAPLAAVRIEVAPAAPPADATGGSVFTPPPPPGAPPPHALLFLMVRSASRAAAVAAAVAALKGHLFPSSHEDAPPMRLIARRLDADSDATARALCASVCAPRLLLGGAGAERCLGAGLNVTLEAAADPTLRLAALCDARELSALLAHAREAALDAAEAATYAEEQAAAAEEAAWAREEQAQRRSGDNDDAGMDA